MNPTKFQNEKTRWLTMSALLIFGKEWNFLYPIQYRHGKHEHEKNSGLIHISEFRLYKDRLVCILFYILTFCSLTSCIPLRVFIGYEIRTENLSVFFFSLFIAKCLDLKLTRFGSLVPFGFRILKVVPLKVGKAPVPCCDAV